MKKMNSKSDLNKLNPVIGKLNIYGFIFWLPYVYWWFW